jgi:hypothetical protein
MLSGVWESVREWTFTLPNELLFWELESRRTSKSSESNRKGQNPLDWKVFYITEKLLEVKCLKWARMTHLDTSNTMAKKKVESQIGKFDSRPLEVRSRPNFLVCRWCATYCWKDFNKSYNFSLDLILIEGLYTKLCAPKVMGIPTLGISKLPLGSPGIKQHLSAGPVAKHKTYYKGENGGFPQVRAVVSLVSLCLPMVRLSTKITQTMQ